MAPSKVFRPVQNICAPCARHQHLRRHFTTSTHFNYASESHLPRVAQPSFWSSLIPKPFRRTATSPDSSAPTTTTRSRFLTRPRDWNPATIFILLGILVGSNSIQILTLRNETLTFSRKTEAKLSLLREVVQRVKAGEEVDVKGLLGTGDAEKEAEWEEVIKELERTDGLAEGRRKREAKRAEKAEQRRLKDEERQEDSEPAENVNERRPKFLM